MTAFTYHSLWSTCVHEAWPGHYLHGLHTRNAPSPVTKTFGSYAFTEGWAPLLRTDDVGDGLPR
jgi:uncharacterized protein (DUF885 family)